MTEIQIYLCKFVYILYVGDNILIALFYTKAMNQTIAATQHVELVAPFLDTKSYTPGTLLEMWSIMTGHSRGAINSTLYSGKVW